jgi:RNA polymerase sigma-70 factor (ECF subfamily)
MSPAGENAVLLEHLFRRQAGRMVAHLARLLGPANLDLAEESVQEAMLRALQSWPDQGIPEQSEAWLFRVAHNAAIDAIRRRRRFTAEQEEAAVAELTQAVSTMSDLADLDEQLRDEELRMLFMCCHPEIPREASVALSLKMVGGFSVREIARAFLADDAAVAQRLVRAKRQIRDRGMTLDMPGGAELPSRLDAVLEVIYFLFNEGYAAHEGDALIRSDLCGEALRLGQLITASSLAVPRAHALVALMALQAARTPARVDPLGDLVLLEQQDRSRWDRGLMALGFRHFEQSAEGAEMSEYHAQAAIAATHARAAPAGEIDWRFILALYDDLLALNPSPVVALNRAVAVARVHGPGTALAEIEPLRENLKSYYLLLALRGHLLLELDRPREAAESFRAALECRCSEPERRFLRRKLEGCEEPGTDA